MTMTHLTSIRDGSTDAQVHIDYARALGEAILLAVGALRRTGEGPVAPYGCYKQDVDLVETLAHIQRDQLAEAMKCCEVVELAEGDLRRALFPPELRQAAA